MKFILIPIGSAGDVFPCLGLAESLARRGRNVLLLINGYFIDIARRHGLDCQEVSSADDFLRVARDPRVWRPIRGPMAAFEYATGLIEPVYQAICAAGEPADSVLVSSCLGWGARIAQDRHGYAGVTIDLQPATLWSAVDPPRLPAVSRRAPRWWNQLAFSCGQKLLLDPVCCPAINDFRRRLQLPDIRHIIDWCHSPDLILGMFPSWYAERPADWPDQVRLTDFPLWDDGAESPMSSEVEAFLQAGEPPVVVTPGSANPAVPLFFELALSACRQLGKRVLLVTRFEDQVPRRLPPEVRRFEYVSFAQLLPRAAALIHHGGIGTTARALAAGVPQLIRPFSHDQPDNSRRVQRLGVGQEVSLRESAAQWAAKLRDLLTRERVRTRCRQLALRLEHADPFARSCQLLEEFAVLGGQRPQGRP